MKIARLDNEGRVFFKNEIVEGNKLFSINEQGFIVEEIIEGGVFSLNSNSMIVKEFIEDYEFPVKLPGGDVLVGGSLENGYYGKVSHNELFNGVELANICGITEGKVGNILVKEEYYATKSNQIQIIPRRKSNRLCSRIQC